jgi:malonate transporter MadL subunit
LVIYGVAFLAGCLLSGLFLGDLLGQLIGVQANVGGVGIAMLMMILLSDRLRSKGKLSPISEQGVLFWSAIYIPVVVAMAAKQNVLAAVEGGATAILAGAGAVVLSFALVPILSRVGAGRGLPPRADDSEEGPGRDLPSRAGDSEEGRGQGLPPGARDAEEGRGQGLPPGARDAEEGP